MKTPYMDASTEPLDVIEANECYSQQGSLATNRFRRLFNELRAARDWRPIDTAPKDNRHAVDLWTERDEDKQRGYRGRVPNCIWSDRLQAWWWLHGSAANTEGGAPVNGIVTHWRPRPAPPEGQ